MDYITIITEECNRLVKATTGFKEDDENYQKCLDFAVSNLLYHNYVETNPFLVKQKILKLCEKFQIQSDINKARLFKSVTENIIQVTERKLVQKKNECYSIIALLLDLAQSQPPECSNVKQILSCKQPESPPFDWATYLREDDIICKFSSSSEESLLCDSIEEACDTVPDALPDLRPPVRDDSGLGISPDSCSSQHFRDPPPGDVTAVRDRRHDTFYPYWLKRWQKTGRPVTNGHSISDNLYTLIEKKVVVHERNVIKEVLWMLSGVKELFIAVWDGHKFIPNSQLHIVELTSHTLGVVLSDFCSHATRLLRMREQLAGLSGPDQRCRTLQAYACAVLDCVRDVMDELRVGDEELRAAGGVLTLLSFHERVLPQLRRLDLLQVLHSEATAAVRGAQEPCELSCRLLHALWTLLVRQSVQEKDSDTLKVLLSVFLKTCRPYFSFMEELLILGAFEDPHGEFIVRKESLTLESEDFWERGYSLRSLGRDMGRDFFLGPFLPDILCGAASLEVLCKAGSRIRLPASKGELYLKFIRVLQRLIGVHEVDMKAPCDTPVEDAPIREDPLLKGVPFPLEGETARFFRPDVNPAYEPVFLKEEDKLFSEQYRDMEWCLSSLSPCRLDPLMSRVERAVRVCVESAYLPVSRRLVHSLKTDARIERHLGVMKKYFLMESGHLMYNFYSEVFQKISVDEPWLDLFFLSSTFRNAIIDDKETFKKLTIVVDSESNAANSHLPLTQLSAIRLCYEVEWPASIVLGPRVQSKYCEVFHFLMQVKGAKYLLDNLHFVDLRVPPPPSQLVRALNQLVYPNEQKVHGMRIIRMRLMFFVNGLHSYLMNRIQHCSDDDVSSAQTAAAMISAHLRHLRSLRERCLLDRRIGYLREQVLQVLHLCGSFTKLWSKGVQRVSREELFQIESQFTKLHNILLCCFNTPLKRGTHVHLEHLVHTMLSDSHSQHLFKD